MEPWKYDYACLVMPWREVDPIKTYKWGVMWDDGVVTPSPACKRALQTVVNCLRKAGHEVIDFHPPSPYEGLKLASQLLISDGGRTATQYFRTGESNDPGVRHGLKMASLPSWLRRLYVWYVRYIKRDEIYAGLIEGWHERNVFDYWPIIAQREAYRRRWFDAYNGENIDFVITVPSSLPAVPHGGMKHGFKGFGYTVLFNLLDYSAGVLPVTHVHAGQDELVNFKPRNSIEKKIYEMYDSKAMQGLPVGVQIVGRRLEEEKVLHGMEVVEESLRQEGLAYQIHSI